MLHLLDNLPGTACGGGGYSHSISAQPPPPRTISIPTPVPRQGLFYYSNTKNLFTFLPIRGIMEPTKFVFDGGTPHDHTFLSERQAEKRIFIRQAASQ